jgi:DNA replication and repair protein RecF
MLVTRIRVLGFRNLRAQEVELGPRITLLRGPNGSGKTNLLEALYTALAGRSCRTRSDREVIAFGEPMARVEVELDDAESPTFLWSLARGGDRRHLLDATPMSPELAERRPPLAVFLPDRLALVKGPPTERRAHMDGLLAALWPARADARRRYARALAQRNALLGRVRAGVAAADSLEAWEQELAAVGLDLMEARRDAIELLATEFARGTSDLGLPGEASLRYAPRSKASTREELAAELAERRASDVDRGYSQHGPHLDELEIAVDGRSVRRYASQGEQRAALLALLFAERRALLDARRHPPLLLLDDVMSELDPDRRELLAATLADGHGQVLITATEAAHLPQVTARTEIAMREGAAARQIGSAERAPQAFAA